MREGCKKELKETLKEASNNLVVNHHSVTTTAWSSGYKKGFDEAIKMVLSFMNKECNKDCKESNNIERRE